MAELTLRRLHLNSRMMIVLVYVAADGDGEGWD
jgi:hypothetical protein